MIALGSRTPRARGLTLLEALAVVVLLGMTAGLAAATLGRASDDARLRSALVTVLAADDAARLLAQAEGGSNLSLSTGIVELTSPRGTRSSWSLPTGLAVNIEQSSPLGANDSLKCTITFNARGCTSDYTLRLATPDRRTTEVARRINGLTGWPSTVEGSSP